MNRVTKELTYIKKVWEDRDGPGKDERYANVLRDIYLPGSSLIFPGCDSMTALLTPKEDIGLAQ